MTRIHNILVLAAVCVVVADEHREETAKTDVCLFEFDLEDLCYNTAKAKWAFLTRPGLSGTVLIEEEQVYGDKFRMYAKEVAPYLKEEFSDAKLNTKLHLFSHAGDILIDKEKYDKEVLFSNSLQQIAIEPSACTKTPCQLDLQSVQHVLANSQDPERLLNTWTEYQRRFSSNVDEYLEILRLTKVAAEANGAEDVETYWEQQSEFRGGYTKALLLWKNIEPLYQKLHAFVSKQLSRHYVFLRSTNDTNDTVIPVHVLGTVAGNDWTYIADNVLYSKTYHHLITSLKDKVLGGVNLYKAAENMITKLGLDPLPSKFWEQSWFNSSCPAHVVSYCKDGEARVITCNLTGWPQYVDAYETVMGVKHIQLAEKSNSFMLKDNSHYSAIYESVTGLSALLATSPFYLRQLGLLTFEKNQQGSVDHTKASRVLLVALQTLPKLPYYLAADQWRLEVLKNNLTNVTELNESWRIHRKNMQMISIPTIDEMIFDFLSDPYITSNKPYLGKFCGIILQFQLLEKVLGADWESSEEDMTDKFTSNEDLKKLLRSGKSHTWPDLLEEVMEISDLDSGPLLKYFKELESYLVELEQLEPIKRSRLDILSTSTAAPPTTVMTVSESLNDTEIYVNSTISSVEPNSAINESESKYATGTVVVLGCAGLVVVAVVIAIFVFGRRHFSNKTYSPTSTQET